MLDFRRRVRARNHLLHRAQWRLVAWAIGIGLIVLVCGRFADISRLLRQQSARAANSIDTRFQPHADGSTEPDTVTIRGQNVATIEDDSPSTRELSPELLARVRDDTPWIRSDEIETWLNLWGVLRRSSDEELARSSMGRVGFVELFGQPRAFRGKLVTIRGSARQAIYVKAAENSAGIDGYYRVIIWPEGGPAEPIFLYALELPPGFPTGEEIRADIEATGFFFKRMVYPSMQKEEPRRAPVVMARTLTSLEPAGTVVDHGPALHVLIGLTVLGIAGLIGATWWATTTRLPLYQRSRAALPPIDDRDVVSVNESLVKLAETDR